MDAFTPSLRVFADGMTAADVASISVGHPSGLKRLSVLMPILNERWTLRQIVTRVLNAPVPLEIELIAVDDCSTDGSWELLQELAQQDSRVVPLRHSRQSGKGVAIRTAIAQMTGDVAVIQDADLEYDPTDIALLLEPILQGKADAVLGSRFAGHNRRVLFFWHSLVNRALTLISNVLNDLNLTDMETGYKMVRADVLKRLRLSANTFTIEPELVTRLAQWDARIYEVPISYFGRTYQEGKKIRPIDALKAIGALIRCVVLDPQFTDHSGFYILSSVANATAYNRWILDQVRPFLGQRLLEAGAGIGNLSALLLNRQRLVLADFEEMYVSALHRRWGWRENVRVDHSDLTDQATFHRWHDERLDTVFCSNVLEHLEPDEEVLANFQQTLVPGGHCIIVVPAGRWLYTGMDAELGHCRRYSRAELEAKMRAAGFEIVLARQFNRFGSLSWAFSGHVMQQRHLSSRQMIWFDRCLPFVKLLDRCLPVPGMSLIVVGRKPERAQMRQAA